MIMTVVMTVIVAVVIVAVVMIVVVAVIIVAVVMAMIIVIVIVVAVVMAMMVVTMVMMVVIMIIQLSKTRFSNIQSAFCRFGEQEQVFCGLQLLQCCGYRLFIFRRCRLMLKTDHISTR